MRKILKGECGDDFGGWREKKRVRPFLEPHKRYLFLCRPVS